MLCTLHKHKAACGSASEGKLWCSVDPSGRDSPVVGGTLEYSTFDKEPVDWAESTGLQTRWRSNSGNHQLQLPGEMFALLIVTAQTVQPPDDGSAGSPRKDRLLLILPVIPSEITVPAASPQGLTEAEFMTEVIRGQILAPWRGLVSLARRLESDRPPPSPFPPSLQVVLSLTGREEPACYRRYVTTRPVSVLDHTSCCLEKQSKRRTRWSDEELNQDVCSVLEAQRHSEQRRDESCVHAGDAVWDSVEPLSMITPHRRMEEWLQRPGGAVDSV